MSTNTSNFTSKKVNYGLNIEVLSIDLKDQDVRESLADYRVQVKFAEKCMEINPDGDRNEPAAIGEQANKDPFQLPVSRMTVTKTSKAASNLYFSPNDADDERSTNSDNIRKNQKRDTSRETTRGSKEDEFYIESSDEDSVNMQRKTEREASRETKTSHSRQSRRETVREIKRDTANHKMREMTITKGRSTTRKTEVASESFGYTEEVFEVSPNCMSGLLAKHCFKYEVLKDCQLYGEFLIRSDLIFYSKFTNFQATTNQLLTECFANPIRTEKFQADNINMKLVLLDLENQNCGSMDVCITIRKVGND